MRVALTKPSGLLPRFGDAVYHKLRPRAPLTVYCQSEFVGIVINQGCHEVSVEPIDVLITKGQTPGQARCLYNIYRTRTAAGQEVTFPVAGMFYGPACSIQRINDYALKTVANAFAGLNTIQLRTRKVYDDQVRRTRLRPDPVSISPRASSIQVRFIEPRGSIWCRLESWRSCVIFQGQYLRTGLWPKNLAKRLNSITDEG